MFFTTFCISLLFGCEANLEDTHVNMPLDHTQAPLCDTAKKMLAEGYEGMAYREVCDNPPHKLKD